MKNLLLFMMVIGLFSCKQKDENGLNPDCPGTVVISASQFDMESEVPFEITGASITDNCLEIIVTHSGGCEELEYTLVDADVVMESFPVQRNIRLDIKGMDPCDGIVVKTLLFDITSIQASGEDQANLNLQGWDEQLYHQYD